MSAAPPAETPLLLRKLPGHVAVVTLNRPQAANAVTAQMARELEAVVRQTEADDAVWAVVLTGAGDRCFCAGADLHALAAGQADTLRTAQGGFAGFVQAARSKPWIAALNGAALGGGCEIALACDMVVAAEHARIGLPEVLRGLIAGAGGLFRLPRAVPPNIAMELIATARALEAAEAHRWGLVNRLAPQGQALEAALQLAAEITRNAPVAVRESLRVARAASAPSAELLALNEQCRAVARASQDYLEGATAFIEKRTPQWQGC
jgi:enoyl-CoA hydratase/carnithine racemase